MNLLTYLEGLPALTLAPLYDSNWTCQAVLRSLPPLAKQYVLRLLWIDDPIAMVVLNGWATPSSAVKHKVAVHRLLGLQVLQPVDAQVLAAHGGGRAGVAAYVQALDHTPDLPVLLNPRFKRQLRWAVTGGLAQTLRSGGGGGDDDGKDVDEAVGPEPGAARLDAYATAQWETLLLYVAGNAPRPPEMPKGLGLEPLNLKQLVASAGLKSGSVTMAGFQFLLMDTYHQLWALLKDYIDAVATTQGGNMQGSDLSSVISFLLQLGFRPVGRPWSLASLPPAQRAVAGHMCQLGLLMPLRASGRVLTVCPTRMAAALSGASAAVAPPPAGAGASDGVGGMGGAALQQVSQGFIIVETNYRVYAYTSSALAHHILRMFVRPEVLLPGMFVGTLTRESVTNALESGLDAEQLVSYLSQHAHPQAAKRVPVVPRVVADQIRLWQAELHRVTLTEAVLYKDFERADYFHRSAAFARQRGVWLWDDGGEVDMKLVARQEGHDAMREYIKSIKMG